jgi:hypothetical protein
MVERCGDRQIKFDGLQKWPFHLFVESLPVMLQIALLLLSCGICQYVASINTVVATVLITLTGLGVLFYIGIVVVGASSYDCPFQTPASTRLRSLWTKIGPRITPVTGPAIAAFQTLGKVARNFLSMTFFVCFFIPYFLFRHLLEKIQLGTRRGVLFFTTKNRRPSCDPPLPTQVDPLVPCAANPQETVAWVSPADLAMIQKRNTDDIGCVSWILRNITDAEALDTAVQRAGTVWWFEDKMDVEPLYQLITSVFHTCFGSDRKLYPGSRDRAYYSGQAILWIHTLAACKSREAAWNFSLPTTEYYAPASDRDLVHLLSAVRAGRYSILFRTGNPHSSTHLQWVSNLVLHLSRAARIQPAHSLKLTIASFVRTPNITQGATHNYLLMWCNLLGSPVGDEVLKIHDKS